jgi:excisionase family DNA binding protein
MKTFHQGSSTRLLDEQQRGERIGCEHEVEEVLERRGMWPMVDFEPTLTSGEAAALLQIHPKTLQRMARDRRVPALRIGDLWRFRASELDEWLRSEVSSPCHPCRN